MSCLYSFPALNSSKIHPHLSTHPVWCFLSIYFRLTPSQCNFCFPNTFSVGPTLKWVQPTQGQIIRENWLSSSLPLQDAQSSSARAENPSPPSLLPAGILTASRTQPCHTHPLPQRPLSLWGRVLM